ncbi:glycoside hydrolase family 108 protein [Brucella intermedia]|uniref:Secretion activating protein n=1 Tax=Brucella intermedia M86 TaxID=1234597 RepID=M5JKF6_9HYPH|nr:glycoside hydrolase family 108 protein [Brucella intermedia]ELT46818.1 secretion activating protein [Brucella intermedia M86]
MAKGTFAKAMPHVFSEEGGYVDHPKDPGGATNMGITLATLSAWEGRRVSKAEVEALTKAKATDIYRENYWNKVSGDDLPAGVDYATLDFAIHSGPARAVKMLQKVVGVDQDGVIGAKTLAAVRKIAADRIINELCDARLAWLKGLGTFSTFGRGWTSRVSRVRSRALAFSRDSAPVPSPVPQVPTGKAVQSDTSLIEVLKKPEAWGPLGGLITGVGAMADGSGPMQWALAVAMVALVGIGLYFFIQRVRKEA